MINGTRLIIFGVSLSILLLISTVYAVTVYSYPRSGLGHTTQVLQSSESCHVKILDYARMGAYKDKATFEAAMSFCSVPTSL